MRPSPTEASACKPSGITRARFLNGHMSFWFPNQVHFYVSESLLSRTIQRSWYQTKRCSAPHSQTSHCHCWTMLCPLCAKVWRQRKWHTLISTMSAASTATSVPVPIATPMSAWASAGESFTPSPTIATMCPLLCNSFTLPTFSSGSVSANTFDMPTWPQT